ncbi:hypothetical protein KGQ20_34155 [Catenulispora sp. NF23]|uniref:Uncharacterized protein n=1 Tax=Catenulispora pinistramenti TaxID=2705254 RepID=A0ABS5KV94_9ACTN|nr:hypothetical protein [Catenulispora pinistramenti]MBS2537809.1 hypothetical protein [Catenulispora pinistramenti]MBS2549972.1 hypothetical protein [Catenulispora pinistramenti]
MNEIIAGNLKTAAPRRRDRITDKRRRFSGDAFFADSEAVEDDYRRLKGGHG